jgi:sugar-specific transcriptional regulator TrmB
MNSWRLNGMAGHLTRSAICKKLGIHHTEIYKVVKDIEMDGVITTKEGKKYKLELKEIE